MINELATQIHENAKSKGFYDAGISKNIAEKLCLIHSEVSEALEADRKGLYFIESTSFPVDLIKGLADPNYGLPFQSTENFKWGFTEFVKNTFEDEMADIIIRVLDLCAFKQIDIESHIKAKMRYNATRTAMHGKKY